MKKKFLMQFSTSWEYSKSCISMTTEIFAIAPMLNLVVSSSLLLDCERIVFIPFLAIVSLCGMLKLRLQKHAATSCWISKDTELPARTRIDQNPASISFPPFSFTEENLLIALNPRHCKCALFQLAPFINSSIAAFIPILIKI